MDALKASEKAEIAVRLIVYLVGVIGNLLVIFVILYLKEYKKITHWYVLQLAVADLIFLQAIPFAIAEIVAKEWFLPVWLCKAKQSVMYINYYASIIFLTLMSLDRYLAVCHGLTKLSQRVRSLSTCYIITIAAWISAVLLCIPVMIIANKEGAEPSCTCKLVFPHNKHLWCEDHIRGSANSTVENCLNTTYVENFDTDVCKKPKTAKEGSSDYLDYIYDDLQDDANETPIDDGFYACLFNKEQMGAEAFVLFNFIVMFVIPLITISVCYSLIVLRLRKTEARSRRGSEHNESSHSGTETTRRTTASRPRDSRRRKSSSGGGSSKQKTRVVVMCAVLVLLFATCWLPFHVVQLAKLKGIDVSKTVCGALDIVTLILLYMNSALNPYLYNFLGTFSKRMRQIRKHKRTKSLMTSMRLTRIGQRTSSFASSSESAKTKKTSIPNENSRIDILKEEIPLTSMNYHGENSKI